MPSRLEPFGIVILEAWHAGVPVVATSRGGPPELVHDGDDGVLVDPFDTQAFARVLEGLLLDPGNRDRVGQAGRLHVQAFDWAVIADRSGRSTARSPKTELGEPELPRTRPAKVMIGHMRPREDRCDDLPNASVGIDLLEVSEVVESVERFGNHYVERIFTPHEIACCRRETASLTASPDYSYESLAARFAAKEAVVKVLQPVGPRPAWRDIEVHRAPNGWTEIRLSGLAAVIADQAGIDDLAVSMTHERSAAAAVVVGFCGSGEGKSASGRAAELEDGSVTERLPELESTLEERNDHGRDHPTGSRRVRPVGDRPESIDENADLFDAGMTSHASVNVMLALEEAFDFEFPENMLKKSTFESIAAIRSGVLEVTNRMIARAVEGSTYRTRFRRLLGVPFPTNGRSAPALLQRVPVTSINEQLPIQRPDTSVVRFRRARCPVCVWREVKPLLCR